MKTRLQKQSLTFGLSLALVSLGLISPNAARAQAYTSTQRFAFPLNIRVDVPCANNGVGEIINATATLHVVTHTTVMSGNNPPLPGDRISMTFMTRAEVLDAYGESSGTRYTAVQGGGEQYHATYTAPDNGPWAFTYHRDVHLRGPRGQQIRWRILQHGTITPDLRVVLDSFTETFGCN